MWPLFVVTFQWLVIGLLIYTFYKWLMGPYNYFEKQGIPFLKPIPLLGNFAGVILQRESFFQMIRRMYSTFPNSKIFGAFEMRIPFFVVRDPEIIKQITVKDFDYFVNHRVLLESEDDPLFGNSLVTLRDQKWKIMRSTLSPSFTGSKMRIIFQLIEECCQTALEYLKNQQRSGKLIDMNMKEFFTRFTNDVIASSAFGLKVNSLTEKDNEFYKMGLGATTFDKWINLKVFMFSNFKKLMKFFKVKLFDEKFSSYFFRLVIDTMKYRKEHGVVRPDMIQLLMEARENSLSLRKENVSNDSSKSNFNEWSDEKIVAQCFNFFVAGFESSASLMSFIAHELMENPDVQENLLNEIDAVKEELGDKPLTYDILQNMKYLDMVVSETLRKWPPSIVTDRVCTKTYKIYDDSLKREILFRPGDFISIPILAIHHDPKYYPEPERFDPERFNDENKSKINQFTYLPFGAGPRNCIGSRFALMESKAILFHMLSKYTFQASPKTSIPIEISASGFLLVPKNGFWLKLVPRH